MRIARVFTRKTKMSPLDDLAYFDVPGAFDDADEVHVSVTFTWDIPRAEYLAKQWERVAPVKIGGPAFNDAGGEFEPGMYVKRGAVITSRGCPNRCWFCSVWKREPKLQELKIHNGNNVLDDNILACSDDHIIKVFDMLSKESGVEFTGGFEAKRFKPWHIDQLKRISLKQVFFAYDTPDDEEPLEGAAKLLDCAGIGLNKRRVYCLVGYKRDTFELAEKRLRKCLDLGFLPMAMLWRDLNGLKSPEWGRFQREWVRPAIVRSKI